MAMSMEWATAMVARFFQRLAAMRRDWTEK